MLKYDHEKHRKRQYFTAYTKENTILKALQMRYMQEKNRDMGL